MRFTSYTVLAMLTGTMLIAPLPAPAASKDMMDLQRDVADLTAQVTDMRKALDTQISSLQAMVQQSLDTANKTSSSVSSLNSGVTRTLQSELSGVKDQLTNVTGVSVKVDNISNDVSDLHNSVASLVVAINRMQQQLTDLTNQVKLMQAPAAAPPGADTSSAVPGAAPATAPAQPSATTLFNNAVRDQNANNLDLALDGFSQFLHLYPNDVNAIRAQYYIGNIYYSQGKLADAVTAYNAVTEQYDENQTTTPSAYYMKGMALKKQKKLPQAKASFETVVRKFPHADEAGQARSELTSLGGASATKRKAASEQ